jgi:ElaB/YqjD/DUF883 family membrane-anchored ribosome-binding protein
MSETQVPYGSGPGSPGPTTPDDQSSGGKHATGVKDRVSDAASHATDAGREVAGDAKEKARDVAHEATDRARGLVDQARSGLSSQAGAQQQRLADGLRALGDEMKQMASGTQDPGYASDLVQRAGDATGQVAQWFEDREPASVLREVEDFARRRPGMFIAIAAGAGLVVGRLLRGAKDAGSDGDPGGTASSSTGYGTTGYTTAGTTGSGYSSGAGAGVTGTTTGGGTSGDPLAGRTGPYGIDDPLAEDAGTGYSTGATSPPSFPPPTPSGGTGSSTTGGEADVERT